MGAMGLSTGLFAQDGRNPVNYGTLAQQFISNTINGDAASASIPSVAIANGYGSFVDNPAAVALFNNSFFSIGYLSNNTNNNSIYLGSETGLEGGMGRLSNMGFIYSAPTTRGSLVFGGGYNLSNSQNRMGNISAFNENNSITDLFKDPGSQYYDMAFNTYATDYYDEEQTIRESIFRIGFDPNDFQGIYQDAEVQNRFNVSELSLFTATEFQKNLFLGVSVALQTGSQSYTRNFLESDTDNIYNYNFLFADELGEGGTDIYSIYLNDEITSSIIGSSIRLGFLNKISKNINVGASYLIPTKLYITEEYSSILTTNFDDGTFSEDSFAGDFTYAIKKPGQFNFGVALIDIANLTITASSEWINYSGTEVLLTIDQNLNFDQKTALRDEEQIMNENIDADYQMVTNLKGGLIYTFANKSQIRLGGGNLPAKTTLVDARKWYMSGGFGYAISANLFLDVSAQYLKWNDRSIVYDYVNNGAGQWRSESVQESLSQLNVWVGLKVKF
jgi:hypothetical protein